MSPEETPQEEQAPEVAEPKATKAEKPKAASKPKAAKASEDAEASKAASADTSESTADAPAEKAPAAKKAAAKKPAAKKAPKAEKPAEETTAAEKPAKPRRGAKKDAPAAPKRRVVSAHARYVRTSARKARMVCGHIRGKSIEEARAILAFTPREVARDWSKLLESAVANAESNHELLEDDLIVREAYADEGPTIKRFRPRAMGRAAPIRKRTSHLTITLTPRPEPGNPKRHG
jgi:ribosomal protein L22